MNEDLDLQKIPEDVWDSMDDDAEEDRLMEKECIEIMNWSDLENKQFPATRWRINNLLPRQGIVFLASIAGEGKSWLGIEMARSIAQGIDFLGHPEFSTFPGNVLYIDAEMGEVEFQRRGKQLNLQEDNKNIFIVTSSNMSLASHGGTITTRVYADVSKIINEKEITTVFIDTFRAVAGGLKEEKAEEVRTFLNHFQLWKDKGVCVVFLEHCRKPNNFEGKVPKKEHLFGSQDKVAMADSLLMIKSNSTGTEISMYQRKSRLGKEINPFSIKMEDSFDNTGSMWTTLTYDGDIEGDRSVKEDAREFIREILKDAKGYTTNEIHGINRKGRDIGKRNLNEVLRNMTEEDVISREKRGRQYFYFIPEGGEPPKNAGREKEVSKNESS